jgi:hypothetical protein
METRTYSEDDIKIFDLYVSNPMAPSTGLINRAIFRLATSSGIALFESVDEAIAVLEAVTDLSVVKTGEYTLAIDHNPLDIRKHGTIAAARLISRAPGDRLDRDSAEIGGLVTTLFALGDDAAAGMVLLVIHRFYTQLAMLVDSRPA